MTIVKYFLLAIIILILIFPLYWMIQGSFLNTAGIMHMPPRLIPKNLITTNYETLIFGQRNIPDTYFFNWIVNSAILIGLAIALTVALTLPAGYAFSVYKFKGRKGLFWLFMSTMMVHRYILIIPMFVVIRKLHLPSRLAAVLPLAFSPLLIFLTKNFVDTIPRSLLDYATLEGVGELRKIFTLILPLCGPLVGVLALFSGLGAFGDYLWQLLLFFKVGDQTLPVGLIQRTRQTIVNIEPIGLSLAAGTILFMVMFVIFLFTSKYFTRGLSLQGVKG